MNTALMLPDTGPLGAGLGQNLRFNPGEIKKGKQIVTKLWNVAKFIDLNLENFEEKEVELEASDLWILKEMNETIKKATESFDRYEYAKARNDIEELFMGKFCDYYIEFVKYRLYGEDGGSKTAAQATLKSVFVNILKMFAPILPFITEEIYQNFGKESIHVSKWPEAKKTKTEEDFLEAIAAIDEIRKYKSENQVSLGAELEEYKLETKVNLDKYGEFIKRAIRVKSLS